MHLGHHERGQLRNPPIGYASLTMTTLFLSSLPQRDAYGANPGLVRKASGEAIPCSRSGAKSMRYISWRRWLRSPCTGIASLPMTYFCFFVIANPVCWLWQGVKRSPTRGTRTGSIRSHTRGGQLRNPPTNYASLAVTINFPILSFQLQAFSRKWYHSP